MIPPAQFFAPKEEILMKYFSLFVLVLILAACGSEAYMQQTVIGGFCETASECACPNGYESSCEDNTCLCLKTETIETGCQVDEDCECGADPMIYEPVCQETGICYCKEVNKECYLLTRGEFIYRLMRELIDLESYVPPTAPTYPDVPSDHEFYAAIEAAVELEIIDGFPDGLFRPDDSLNRAEGTKAVIMAINGLESYTPPTTPTYLDVEVDAWFYDYVEAATQLELTKGYVHQDGTPTGYFGPADVASSCFMDAMMLAAKLPSLFVSIVVDMISDTNLIAIEGFSQHLSAHYRVFGTSANKPLNYLRIINQPDGEDTAAKPTLALEQVWLSCAPPLSGPYFFFSSQMDSSGVAEFNNLGCYDETGLGLKIYITYNVEYLFTVGEILSGQVFRLVIDDERFLGTQEDVPVRTVRKTKLEFANVPGSTMLVNGERTLFSFQVSAHSNGSAGLARISFEVDKHDNDGGGEFALNYFKFYRGSTLIADAMIYDTNGNDITGSQILAGSRVIVSFNSEETIAPATTQAYSFKATAMGVEADDAVTTYLFAGDDVGPITGMTSEGTPNTARLISSIGTVGLFSSITQFQAGNPIPNVNTIWSDRSADAHVYSLADSGSSYDWTNGYGFGLWVLSATTLSN